MTKQRQRAACEGPTGLLPAGCRGAARARAAVTCSMQYTFNTAFTYASGSSSQRASVAVDLQDQHQLCCRIHIGMTVRR